MSGLLRSLRSLVFGETWTIPVGVGAALLIAAGLRAALAGLVTATLALALWTGR